jgi:hypothetical protein
MLPKKWKKKKKKKKKKKTITIPAAQSYEAYISQLKR